MKLLQAGFIFLLLFSLLPEVYSQNTDSLLNVLASSKNNLEKYEINFQLTKNFAQQRQWDNVDFYLNKTFRAAKLLDNQEYEASAYFLSGEINLLKGKYQLADASFAKGLKYTDDNVLKFKLYSGRYTTLIRTGGIEKGKTYLDEMRKLIGNDTTSILMGEYYFNLSNYYGEQRQILKNLQYLQKAKKLLLENNEDIQSINHNLTAVFESLKAYEKALELQKELRKSAQKNNSPNAELFSLYGIMSSQIGLKDYEATRKTCFEAINLKNSKNVSEAFGYVYYILGDVHLKTNALDSAEYYLKKGINISEEQNEAKELGDNHSSMAKLMYLKGDLAQARYHAEKARDVVSYINTDNNTILSKIYAQEGNYKSAYETLLINWSDWETKEAERNDYQVISTLLSEKFEQEKAQEQELFKQQVNKERQYLIGNVLIIGMLLLGIIVFIQIRNNRRLKVLNHQLQQQNNALSQFSYIASHDIKEPMRSVGNYIGLIQKKLNPAEQEKLNPYFSNIKISLQQVYTLIEDVMQYTQVNQNKAIERKGIDLNDTLKNIEIGLTTFIKEKNGKIVYVDLPTINSQNSMLFVILNNLIQNGLKFNHSDTPTITITCEKMLNHYQIIVSDNGIGIKPEYHEKIFEMFKRLHNRFEYEGSGIGLAIVKLSVEKLGGKISLESKEGEGCRFVIELPL